MVKAILITVIIFILLLLSSPLTAVAVEVLGGYAYAR